MKSGKGIIPEGVQRSLTVRLRAHVSRKWGESCARVEVSFRGRYAYVDAYEIDPEIGRAEEVPTHLCRLEYVGSPEEWGFAFYKYSDEKYERSYLPTGVMGGTPEECFDCAGLCYL